MNDSVIRNALELAKRWLKDIEGTKSDTALLATVALSEIDALESQYPLGSSSTESEGETDDGWRVCSACGEDYRKGEEIIVDRETDKLRAENERLRAELEDERRQHRFERESHDITREEALKEGEGK